MTEAAPAKISVVIPAYNSRKTIENCILHVLDTGYRPLEIIVVDDASTDDTPDIVEGLSQRHPDLITLVRLDKNAGPAHARNVGAQSSSGAYIFFNDSDTAMLPDALEKFSKTIVNADVVSGIYHWTPVNDEPVAWYFSFLKFVTFSSQGIFEYNNINGPAAGIRRESFFAAGGFDDTLGWGMDYECEEFGRRLMIDNRMLLDPAITVQHTFPGLLKMSRLYFIRLSLWMERFMLTREFETGGPATSSIGLATLFFPAGLLSLPLLLISYWAAPVILLFLSIYLRGYKDLFIFILKKRPKFIAMAVLINWWFCGVISLATAFGFFVALLRPFGYSRVDALPK